MNEKLRHYARFYACRLAWLILPVDPKTKRPLTRHGVKDARTGREALIFWDEFPDANLAIATGQPSGCWSSTWTATLPMHRSPP